MRQISSVVRLHSYGVTYGLLTISSRPVNFESCFHLRPHFAISARKAGFEPSSRHVILICVGRTCLLMVRSRSASCRENGKGAAAALAPPLLPELGTAPAAARCGAARGASLACSWTSAPDGDIWLKRPDTATYSIFSCKRHCGACIEAVARQAMRTLGATKIWQWFLKRVAVFAALIARENRF